MIKLSLLIPIINDDIKIENVIITMSNRINLALN
jgi:hypothetical protein